VILRSTVPYKGLGSGCEPIGFKSNTAWGYVRRFSNGLGYITDDINLFQGHFTYAPLLGEMYEDFPLDLTFGG